MTNLCKDGYRDLAEISTDMKACPGGLPPWHNGFILFSKDGCTEVTGGTLMPAHNSDPTGTGRRVGVGVARQAAKRLTINHGPGGEMFWDGIGSHCSIPIDEANPDTFTLQMKLNGGSLHAYEFQRIKK